MNKKSKFIYLLIGLIVAPVIFLFVLSMFHHKTAHDELVGFINKELDGNITFQEFSFSYLRYFPQVHINLQDISIKDDTNEIAKVGNFDLLLNLKSFWKKELKIEGLIIKDGELHSIVDSLGNKAHLFGSKKKSAGKSPGSLLINANNIKILNTRLHFANDIKGNRAYFYINKSKLDLYTRDSLFLLKGSLTGQVDSLISNNTTLFKGQPVEARELIFTINRYSGEKILKDGYVMAHTLRLEPRFKMKPYKNGQKIEIHISGEDNFNEVLSLFEFHTGVNLIQENPEAKLKIAFNQKGFVNPFLRPYTEVDFEIKDAEFSGDKLPFPLQNVSISGNYNNGKEHTPETVELVIDTIHIEVSDSYVNGRFKLSSLKDPYVDAHLISHLDIGHILKPNDKFRASGQIELNINLNGKISELKKLHLEGKQGAKGEILIRDFQLELLGSGNSIKLKKGTTILNNHFLEVTTLIGDYNQAAFHFKGLFQNLDNYVLGDKKMLSGNLNLNIDTLDMTGFSFEKTQESKAYKKEAFSFNEFNFHLHLFCNKIISQYGDFANFELNTDFKEEIVIVREVSFRYQQGGMKGNGEIILSNGKIDSVYANLKGEFDHLNFSPPKDTAVNTEKRPLNVPTFVNAELDLKIKQGELFSIPVNDLTLQAILANGKLKIPVLNFEAFDAINQIEGELNFDDNGLKGILADAKVVMPKMDMDKYIHNSGSNKDNGSKFSFSDLPEDIDVKVEFVSKDVHFRHFKLSDLKCNLLVDNYTIQIDDFYSTLPFGKLSGQLQADNYRDNIQYNGELDLKINTLHIDSLLKSLNILKQDEINPGQNDSREKQNTNRAKSLPDNVNFLLTANADEIYYQNSSIQEMDLIVGFSKDSIFLQKLNFGFADGKVNAEGFLVRGDKNNFPGYLHTISKNIDIQETLSAFNNFEQNVFTVENTCGNISWESDLYFQLDEKLAMVTNKNLWKLNIRVHNAEFKQVDPIEKTLFFVGHKAKDDIIVSELDIIVFRDGNKLYFKDVLMNDNIADLDVYGEVDLDVSEMNLGLEISLSDLFFRSKKKKVIETKDGIINLDKDSKVFLKLHGPVSDHKINLISKHKFNKSRQELEKTIRKTEEKFLNRKKLNKFEN